MARDILNPVDTDIFGGVVVDVSAGVTGDVIGINGFPVTALLASQKGQPNGVAGLDANGKVTGSQVPNIAFWQGWKPGGPLASENVDRDQAFVAQTLTSGTLLLCGRHHVRAGNAYTHLTAVSNSQALVSGTHQWFCLVDVVSNQIVAVSNDDTSTAWAANALKTLNITYTPVADTDVYFGVLVTAGTTPNLSGITLPLAAVRNQTPILCSTSSTGLTTPLTVTTAVTAPSSGLAQAVLPYTLIS